MVLPTASRSINKAKGGIDVSKKTLDLRKKRFLTNEDVPSFVAVLSSAATTHSPIPKSTAPSRKRKKLAKARSPFGEAAIFEGGWKDKAPITGTCMSIEKSHFRLTSAPDPNTVRPIHVLKKSLDNVKRMWISNEDYEYAKDQLRSIRQDLNVQHYLHSRFTLEVYQTHARIALEADDIEDFRVCLGQIDTLQAETGMKQCIEEFAAYRILLHLLAQNDGTAIQRTFGQMPPELRRSKPVRHAFNVWRSIVEGNYFEFFKLYDAAPNMSAYLMDDLADRMRQHMLDVLLKSYRLKYPVARFLRIASLPGLQYGVPLLKARKFAIITTEQDDDDDDDDDEEAAQQRRMMIDVDKSRKTASIEADQGGSEAAAVTAKAVQAAATSKERKTASGKAAVRDLEEAVADLANITDMGAKRLKVKQLLGSAKQMAPKFDPRITEAISKIMQHLRETKKGMKSKSKRGKVAAAKGNKKNKNIRKKEKKKKKNKK